MHIPEVGNRYREANIKGGPVWVCTSDVAGIYTLRNKKGVIRRAYRKEVETDYKFLGRSKKPVEVVH